MVLLVTPKTSKKYTAHKHANKLSVQAHISLGKKTLTSTRFEKSHFIESYRLKDLKHCFIELIGNFVTESCSHDVLLIGTGR